MQVNIEASWKEVLKDEFGKPYFQELITFVKQEYGVQKCFPPGKQIFAAFDHCPFDKVEVVILGQDPYHGLGQAHGLCFSVNDGVNHFEISSRKSVQILVNLFLPQEIWRTGQSKAYYS
jgi:uracil-DNA glycosylase